MCGLIGVFHGKRLNSYERSKIKVLFTQLLIANEERGREATGVAAFWKNGKHVIVKKPTSASDFVETAEYKIFLDTLDDLSYSSSLT